MADDSNDDVLMFQEAFRSIDPGASLRRVADGKAALEACDPHSGAAFDIIVLDYHLPKHSGGEVVERLAAWGVVAKVPVVVLSSHLPAEKRLRLLDLGVALVAEKPNDLDALCALARRILALVRGSTAAVQ